MRRKAPISAAVAAAALVTATALTVAGCGSTEGTPEAAASSTAASSTASATSTANETETTVASSPPATIEHPHKCIHDGDYDSNPRFGSLSRRRLLARHRRHRHAGHRHQRGQLDTEIRERRTDRELS